jgi:hypothetical protein
MDPLEVSVACGADTIARRHDGDDHVVKVEQTRRSNMKLPLLCRQPVCTGMKLDEMCSGTGTYVLLCTESYSYITFGEIGFEMIQTCIY